MTDNIELVYDPDRYPTIAQFHKSKAYIKGLLGPAGCLPHDAKVRTRSGWVPISTVRDGDVVAVYHPSDHYARWEQVGVVAAPADGWWVFETRESNKISTPQLRMKLSPEHKVWAIHPTAANEGRNLWTVMTATELAETLHLTRDHGYLIPTDVRLSYLPPKVMPPVPGDKVRTNEIDYGWLPADSGTPRHGPDWVSTGRVHTALWEDAREGEMKYCLTTSTGMFVAKWGGTTFCTGNSGKTYAVVWDLLLDSMAQAPNKAGVRNVRWLVVRNSYPLLVSATIPTFKAALGPLLRAPFGRYISSPPPSAWIKLPMPDGTSLHIDIFFRSFDSEESATNALGTEPTFVFVDEISEFGEQLVLSIIRRAGRYPSGDAGTPTNWGMRFALNGPSEAHWLHEWQSGKRDELFSGLSKLIPHEKYYECFVQPPALLPPDGWESQATIDVPAWKPNPEAENIDNLKGGYGYYFAQLTSKYDNIRAYVLGMFSPLSTGKLVFPGFRKSLHVVDPSVLRIPAQPQLFLSFDFGRTPICLVAVKTTGGRLIIVEEISGEDMAISSLWADYAKPLLDKKYRGYSVTGATGDPAGDVGTQATETSPYEVLWEAGVPIERPPCGNNIESRLEAVRMALSRLGPDGVPMFQISSRCVHLIDAMSRTYVYEMGRGNVEVANPKPTKTHLKWASDLCDGVQYMCSSFLEHKPKKQTAPTTKRKIKWL